MARLLAAITLSLMRNRELVCCANIHSRFGGWKEGRKEGKGGKRGPKTPYLKSPLFA